MVGEETNSHARVAAFNLVVTLITAEGDYCNTEFIKATLRSKKNFISLPIATVDARTGLSRHLYQLIPERSKMRVNRRQVPP